MKLKLVAIIIMFILPGRYETSGQEVNASAHLDTNNLLIGDQTILHLKFSSPIGAKIRWPLLTDTVVTNVEIISRTVIDTIIDEQNNMIQLNQSYLITVFDSGFYAIPPFIFQYRLPNDTNILRAETDPFLLSVYTVDVDTSQTIKPIKAPLKVPITFRELLPYIIIYVLLGILIPGWYYFRKRIKSPGAIISRKPKVPPHVLALESLERLRKQKLWQGGKIKEYHSVLTEIVRNYIEERFHIPAIELTTNEILDSFEKMAIDLYLKGKLKYMLELADLVKFAKAQLLPDEHAECLDKAIEFVRKTIPVVQTIAEESESEEIADKKEMIETVQIEKKS
ncbi:hypothetical protein ACFL6I_22845 [candidate division KSB1 bacterium]